VFETPEFVERIRSKIRSPLLVVLGSPREVVELLAKTAIPDATCFQLDLYQADRLREELTRGGLTARVVTAPDLWDLPADFQTALYLPPQGGERDLKIDMVEQAFQVLPLRGQFVVLSPFEKDQLFPALLKKVFHGVRASPAGESTLFWCQRERERPRRRHEVTFHARVGEAPSLCFLSRPGVFSYGRFDDGARALVETMTIEPGERVLDIGCGCGTNGIFAGKRNGPDGRVTLVDSNLRAVALAELNARSNGLEKFETLASCRLDELPRAAFDVALANPPYYAQTSIAQSFIECARRSLKPGGRLYLVTKQADQVGPIVAEHFGPAEAVERRGYAILSAQAPCVQTTRVPPGRNRS